MTYLSKISKTVALVLLVSLLNACGFHFQRSSDFSPALKRITIVSQSDRTMNFSILLKRRLRALGLSHSNKQHPATATLTLVSLKYDQSTPSITTSNEPQYITGTSTLCFSLQLKHQSTRLVKQCISQSDQIMVSFTTAFNPSISDQLQNQTEQRLVEMLINTLSSPNITQQLQRPKPHETKLPK